MVIYCRNWKQGSPGDDEASTGEWIINGFDGQTKSAKVIVNFRGVDTDSRNEQTNHQHHQE
jgi:hypothetical protein